MQPGATPCGSQGRFRTGVRRPSARPSGVASGRRLRADEVPAAVNHLGRVRLVLLVLALAASMSGHAFGQGKPLGKSDLIRQLTLGMLGKAEVTALVRRNCVTFRPPARGQADARALTNARGVATFRIAAGTTAGTHRLAVALAYGAPPLPGGQIEFVTQPARTLRVTAAPREVTLRPGAAGGAVTVTATDAYGNPLRGLLLELRPVTAELVGAAPLRNTDEQGKATFPLLPAAVRREG